MPIYEYKCSKCGKDLEVFQSFSDRPLTVCPKCKGRLKKIINPAGVIFKGSGFYVTDSRAANSTVKNGEAEGGKVEELKPTASSDKPAGASGKPSETAPKSSKRKAG
jgi:putative FmdB family regulatory protein